MIGRLIRRLAWLFFAASVVAGLSAAVHAAALQVVDSKGQVVGGYQEQFGFFCRASLCEPTVDSAVRNINGVVFGLPVTSQGFFTPLPSYVLFAKSNCSGLALFPAQPAPPSLVTYVTGKFAGQFNNTLFFGSGTVYSLVVRSCALVNDPTKPVPTGACANTNCTGESSKPVPLQVVASFNLTTLHLVPPFKLVLQ